MLKLQPPSFLKKIHIDIYVCLRVFSLALVSLFFLLRWKNNWENDIIGWNKARNRFYYREFFPLGLLLMQCSVAVWQWQMGECAGETRKDEFSSVEMKRMNGMND